MGAGNLGLGVCGSGNQLRMVGEVGGVVHIELYYPTIVVKSITARRGQSADPDAKLRAGFTLPVSLHK